MIETLHKLMRILTRHERRRLALVFLGVLGRALLEVVGVASIMPFLSVVGNPGLVNDNAVLNWLYTVFRFSTVNQFLFFLGFVVMVLLVSTNVFAMLVDWALYRFCWMRNHSLSRRLLIRYLGQPYSFFLQQNSAVLGRNILSETQYLVSGIILPGLQFLASIASAVCILAFLIFVDPMLATLAVLGIGGAYGTIYAVVRSRLERLGRLRVEANRNRFKIAAEAFGIIKLLKLVGREHHLVDLFSRPSYDFSSAIASQHVISRIPRYALEAVAFGGLLLVVLYLLVTGKDVSQALPLIGLYALAGYKLIPALQQIFNGITQVRFHKPTLNTVYEDICSKYDLPQRLQTQKPLRLTKGIELRHVVFSYPGQQYRIIKGLNMYVRSGSCVALLGTTGAGKTTIGDIILGLLRPIEGALYVDGHEITGDLVRQWQMNLGYVPQEIYLVDDTVAANIALAVREKDIDMDVVERVAKIAKIHKFIVNELDDGYETLVGERGVRLSGGERQRIGIARALYRDPQVLVLDEATSALDKPTESAVLQAVQKVPKEKTVIIITHRLTTIRNCSMVYMLDNGQIRASGRYEDLVNRYACFQAMVGNDG